MFEGDIEEEKLLSDDSGSGDCKFELRSIELQVPRLA